jgi:hypothetical protein
LPVLGYFTPYDEDSLSTADLDQGSGGVLLLPDSAGSVAHPHLLIQTGETGRIYLLDRDNLGGYTAGDSGAVQVLPDRTVDGGAYDTPVYFNNGAQQLIYYMGANDVLKAFAVNNGQLSAQPIAQTAQMFGFPGANPTISANGTSGGIVWVLDTSHNGTGRTPGSAVLHAYDATTLTELYSSGQRPADQLGDAVPFTVPTMVNGKVYVGTQSGLYVFGLLPVATGGFTVTAMEGKKFTSQPLATFTDPEGAGSLANYSATIDWGDNSTSVGTITFSAATATFTVKGSHTYTEESQPTITVTIQKGSAPAVTVTSSADVADPAVVVKGGFTLSAAEGSSTGNQTVATFTDPGGPEPVSAYSATINWGGNASSTGAITFNSHTGVFTVSGSHSYAEEGTPTITVTVQHDSAPAATATGSAVIRSRSDIAGRVGSSGEWWVGLSTGSSFTTSKWDTWASSVTWVDVQTGDFTGDGHQDIIGRVLQSGEWWVAVPNGSNGFTTTRWAVWSPNVTWADVKVGDFDGDGKMDIAGRALQSGEWWVGLSTGSSFTTSKWATWSPSVTWVDVNVGDFNGDGKADIVGRVAQSGEWWTGLSTGSSFSTSRWAVWSPSVTWVDLNVGDFNGDGKTDIVGRVLQSGEWWTGLSTGLSFNTSRWAIWSPKATWVDVKVGDFTGDGKDDIIGRVLQSGQWWTAVSTGSSFHTSLWGTWSPAVTWVDVQVGDFTGDGKADLTGRVLQSGEWWTGVSTGSSFSTSLWATWSSAVNWVDLGDQDFG